MERLTYWKDKEHAVLDMNAENVRYATEKLAKYEDAEEQGLMLKLPCKPGDIIFDIDENRSRIYPLKAKNDICFISGKLSILCESSEYSDYISYDDLTKNAFPTREEAEQALKKMESEG